MEIFYRPKTSYQAKQLSLSCSLGSLTLESNKWQVIDDDLFNCLQEENIEFKACLEQAVIISKPSVTEKDTTEESAPESTKPKTTKKVKAS